MFFFFHLLTGIILGVLIGDLIRDYRWVIPCALGAILPDLIDKPLWLVFQSIGYGRIYGHTLLAALALGVLGLLVLKFWKNPVIAGIAAGVISHQVLDLMWHEPINWLYPVYGGFHQYDSTSEIVTVLESEIKNPLEIFLFVCLCNGILVFMYRYHITAVLARHTKVVRSLLACGVFSLCILSGVFIGMSLGKHTLSYLGWKWPEDFIIGGILAAMTAFLLLQWYWKMADRSIE